MNRIEIQKLTARSAEKEYSIAFKGGLNIISGESMTGKTSILQLIDYCFGGWEQPETPEFRKLILALLEIKINDEFYTIERQLFSKKKTAQIHFCRIDNLKDKHQSLEVNVSQTIGEESISTYILSQIGLKGIQLKKAPSQAASETNTLSFRDLLWLCYLERSRVGGKQLLFENQYWLHHKLVQVIEVVFNVYSNTSALLGGELETLKKQVEESEHNKKVILDFLNSQGMSSSDSLREENKKLSDETSQLKARLSKIDETLSGSSDITKALREQVLGTQAILQRIRTEKRSLEKELNLLLPLRAQYNEDISKLTFLNDAKKIFDPLLLTVCPICLQPLDAINKEEGYCHLCHQQISQSVETQSKIDVTKEIGVIRRKSNELNSYIDEVENRIKENETKDNRTSSELARLSQELDTSLKNFVSPYFSERDELKTLIATNESKIRSNEESLRFRNQTELLEEEIIRLKVKVERIKKSIDEEKSKSVSRNELVASLSSTYYRQLVTVNYPKLSDAKVDDDFFPYIKGLRYDKLSSEGAINVSSVCWMTSLFSEAIRRLMHHPGFLIIDSLQTGLGVGPEVSEDFQDVRIVKGLYDLLLEASTLDEECQLIIVDNHPPPYMQDYVIVYYSRDPNKPPYGFIYDET